MANPQIENGYIPIAHDLYAAIVCQDLTALQVKVVLAVIYLTYGAGKKKASMDANDLRLLMGASDKRRTARIEKAVTELLEMKVLFSQQVNDATRIIGIQKDYDKWNSSIANSEKPYKMYVPINRHSNTNTNTSNTRPYKMYVVLEYAYKDSGFKHTGPQIGIELKHANAILKEALELTRSPQDAIQAVKDYIDHLKGEPFFAEVKMRFTFMSSRFKAWYKSIPKKTWDVKEDEQLTGYRYKWSVKNNKWEMSDEKLKPNP